MNNRRGWALLRREEIIDGKTLLSKTGYVIIAENLTHEEAKGYLREGDSYLLIVTAADLENFKKDKKIIT